ncbi:RING finger protein 214 isoform X2 [Ranitomeya variabilis]|uniref:RING finger protein 214 isoform X2 n=2 Tax=Ranitomeya variabilis TaxID=490064 RepID=UPI0040565D30
MRTTEFIEQSGSIKQGGKFRSAGDMPSADLTPGDLSGGRINVAGDDCTLQSGLCDSGGLQTTCIAVQTENEKRDAETITDTDTEKLLKLLVGRGEQLTETYQVVLDRQTQAEKQLQVKIKQQRQQAEEEMQRWKKYLKHIEDLVTKKQETRKKIEKERREHVQKEQDLGADLLKLQRKNDSLEKEHKELENKIANLLAEQTAERKEWEAELTDLKKKQSEANQSATEQIEHMRRAEVSSLESRRDLLLISLEEAEKEAEVTLSYLRVAPPNLEWIALKQRWEARLAGIQQMKANLQEQFEKQIKQVKNGTRLSSLPSILAPDLTPPPSDPSLMLHRIALAPTKMPPADMGPQGKAPQPFQHSHPMAFPTLPFPGNTAPAPSASDSPGPAGADKLSKILEKLQARFPQHDKGHLTDILQQIKQKRGTLSGLTVEALFQLVETHTEKLQLKESANPAVMPISHGRPQYPAAQRTPAFLPPGFGGYPGRPQVCFICQKIVQPHDRQPVSCNHAIHRECAKPWSSSSRDGSCPFCPSHR